MELFDHLKDTYNKAIYAWALTLPTNPLDDIHDPKGGDATLTFYSFYLGPSTGLDELDTY